MKDTTKLDNTSHNNSSKRTRENDIIFGDDESTAFKQKNRNSKKSYWDKLASPNPRYMRKDAEEPPRKKPKVCISNKFCPPRIDQLANPTTVRMESVLSSFHNTLEAERIVRIVKLIHTNQEPKPIRHTIKMKKKKKRPSKRLKKRNKEKLEKEWLHQQTNVSAQLIMNFLSTRVAFTPNYKQVILSLGLMRALKSKSHNHLIRKNLLKFCEQMAIIADHEWEPYQHFEEVESESEEEVTQEELKKHVVYRIESVESFAEEEYEESEESYVTPSSGLEDEDYLLAEEDVQVVGKRTGPSTIYEDTEEDEGIEQGPMVIKEEPEEEIEDIKEEMEGEAAYGEEPVDVKQEAEEEVEGIKEEDEEEVGIKEEGEEEVGIKEEGAEEVGIKEEGEEDVGIKEEGAEEVGIKEEGEEDVGIKEEGAEEVVGIKEEDAEEVRIKEEGAEEVGIKEEGVDELGIKEEGAEEVGIKQEGAEEMGIKEEGEEGGEVKPEDAIINEEDEVLKQEGVDIKVEAEEQLSVKQETADESPITEAAVESPPAAEFKEGFEAEGVDDTGVTVEGEKVEPSEVTAGEDKAELEGEVEEAAKGEAVASEKGADEEGGDQEVAVAEDAIVEEEKGASLKESAKGSVKEATEGEEEIEKGADEDVGEEEEEEAIVEEQLKAGEEEGGEKQEGSEKLDEGGEIVEEGIVQEDGEQILEEGVPAIEEEGKSKGEDIEPEPEKVSGRKVSVMTASGEEVEATITIGPDGEEVIELIDEQGKRHSIPVKSISQEGGLIVLPEGMEVAKPVEEEKPPVQILADHPEGTASYVAYKVYSSWLEEFGQNIQTYSTCLRTFREIMTNSQLDKEMGAAKHSPAIREVLLNWSSYLADTVQFESAMTDYFKGKTVTRCAKCSDSYNMYNLPSDEEHPLPAELRAALEHTAQWKQLLTNAEKHCKLFTSLPESDSFGSSFITVDVQDVTSFMSSDSAYFMEEVEED